MKKYFDETEMFEDFNFKLIVIEALIEKDNQEIKMALENFEEKYEDMYVEQPDILIKEICEYFAEYNILDQYLESITELVFDAENQIYGYLRPGFDGEDDYFNVESIMGYEKLINLKSVVNISGIDESILDEMKDNNIIIM